MTNEYTDVFMLANDTDRGTRKLAGYIYSVEKHIANELVGAGKAKEINYQSLNSHKQEVTKLSKELEEKIAAINENRRLSPEAKLEDIALVKKEIEAKVAQIQEDYNKDLQTLKQSAKQNAKTIELDEGYDANKVRQTVGIVKTEVSMANSFTKAIEAINEQLEFIDRDSARELLSQFSEIKATLEEKGATMQARDDNSRRTTVTTAVRRVYESIKQAAANERQVNASIEYRMLEAIEQYHGNIRHEFDRVARKYN